MENHGQIKGIYITKHPNTPKIICDTYLKPLPILNKRNFSVIKKGLILPVKIAIVTGNVCVNKPILEW
jgi:hypothetical protein